MLEFDSSNASKGDGVESLSGRVYQQLRDDIVFLVLHPGAPLPEIELAKRFEVGRTPVREALQRLAMNYLVEMRSGRGAFVSGISLTEIMKISELRTNLEGFAASRAAARALPEERANLIAIRQVILGLADDTPRSELIRLDQDVHRIVYRATHNTYLEDCLNRYLNIALRAWILVLDTVGGVSEMVDQHSSLLQAIIEGDADKAGALAQEHILDFENEIRTALSNPATRFPFDQHRSSNI